VVRKHSMNRVKRHCPSLLISMFCWLVCDQLRRRIMNKRVSLTIYSPPNNLHSNMRNFKCIIKRFDFIFIFVFQKSSTENLNNKFNHCLFLLFLNTIFNTSYSSRPTTHTNCSLIFLIYWLAKILIFYYSYFSPPFNAPYLYYLFLWYSDIN